MTRCRPSTGHEKRGENDGDGNDQNPRAMSISGSLDSGMRLARERDDTRCLFHGSLLIEPDDQTKPNQYTQSDSGQQPALRPALHVVRARTAWPASDLGSIESVAEPCGARVEHCLAFGLAGDKPIAIVPAHKRSAVKPIGTGVLRGSSGQAIDNR